MASDTTLCLDFDAGPKFSTNQSCGSSSSSMSRHESPDASASAVHLPTMSLSNIFFSQSRLFFNAAIRSNITRSRTVRGIARLSQLPLTPSIGRSDFCSSGESIPGNAIVCLSSVARPYTVLAGLVTCVRARVWFGMISWAE